MHRFVANEKWRKEFGTDELVYNWDYKEKPEVFKYYPQYYHKTDKVCVTRSDSACCDTRLLRLVY